jgi:glycosyltransferase involved in cell wall biosynthesis
MTSPFFSIILPTYNRKRMILKTIESVIQQTFTDWELLVVDDGSTDNTKETISSIKDNRIVYIYQTNKERSAARNNGIKNAKGQYICFLDSDDLFESNHLEILHKWIIKNNSPKELIFTNCYHLQNGVLETPEIPVLENNAIEYFLKNSVIPARVCVQVDILQEFQFREDIVIVEDTVLWVSITNKYPVSHIAEYTIQYRLHDDNSVNIKNNCFLPRLHGLQKLFAKKEIAQKAGPLLVKEIISNCYLGIAKHFEYKRSFFSMIVNLVKSFVVYPESTTNKFKLFMVYKYIFKQNEL